MCPTERRSRRQRGFPRDQFARAASSTPSYGAGGGVAGASVVGFPREQFARVASSASKNVAMARAAAWLAPQSLEWVKEQWEPQRVWVFRMQPRSQFQGRGKGFAGFSWKTSDSERESRRAFAPFWVIYLTGMSG